MRRRLSLARAILAACAVLAAGAESASAGVRAFESATGREASGFVRLRATQQPDALIGDGHHGLYIAGHALSVGGKHVTLVHLLPDGAIDPRFHATIDAGTVRNGAVHGRDLVLIGTFVQIDGAARHDLVVLDAQSGRLSAWMPRLPTNADAGEVGESVVFAAGSMIASSFRRVTAWRDRATRPSWSDEVPIGGTPTLAAAGTRVYSLQGAGLVEVDPASGLTTTVPGDWHESEGLTAAAGGFYLGTTGRYDQLDVATSNGCVAPPTNDSSNAIAGDAQTVFVASAPVDADPPDATQTIAACTRQGRPLPGFTPPVVPLHTQFIGHMAVVGTHLLVFTSRF